jgi:hypothetical protein
VQLHPPQTTTSANQRLALPSTHTGPGQCAICNMGHQTPHLRVIRAHFPFPLPTALLFKAISPRRGQRVVVHGPAPFVLRVSVLVLAARCCFMAYGIRIRHIWHLAGFGFWPLGRAVGREYIRKTENSSRHLTSFKVNPRSPSLHVHVHALPGLPIKSALRPRLGSPITQAPARCALHR